MYTLWFGIFPSCAKRNQKRKEVVLCWMISFGIRCDGTVVHDVIYPPLVDGVMNPLGERRHPGVGWGVYCTSI